MRIAGFIRLLPVHRGVGGMQGHAQNLYRGLAKAGHDVHVFTTSHPQKPEREVEHGVTIHYIKGTPPSVYSTEYFDGSKKEFLRLHKKKPFDIVHSESSSARRLCNGPVPVCATWHGMAYCGFRSKLNEEYARGVVPSNQFFNNGFESVLKEAHEFAKYDMHVAISHQAYDDLHSMYRIPKEQIALVFNGFDGSQFKVDKTMREEGRRRYGLNPKGYVYGAGGRISVDKGHRILIRALPDLFKKHSNVQLLVVGTGQIEGEYKKLRHPQIRFIGPKKYDEMPYVYNAIDCFINPTLRYLGLDMTMQEAMLCGCPVVASDTGSIGRSLLPESKYGLLHTVGSPRDLLKQLVAVKQKEFNRETISEFVRGFSTIDTMVSGMEEAFDRAFSQRRKK